MSPNKESHVDITADILGILPSSYLSNPHPDPLVLYTPQSIGLATLCSQTHKNWSFLGICYSQITSHTMHRIPRPVVLNCRGLSPRYISVSVMTVWLTGWYTDHIIHLLCFPEGRAQWMSVNKSRKYIQACYRQQGETCQSSPTAPIIITALFL